MSTKKSTKVTETIKTTKTTCTTTTESGKAARTKTDGGNGSWAKGRPTPVASYEEHMDKANAEAQVIKYAAKNYLMDAVVFIARHFEDGTPMELMDRYAKENPCGKAMLDYYYDNIYGRYPVKISGGSWPHG